MILQTMDDIISVSLYAALRLHPVLAIYPTSPTSKLMAHHISRMLGEFSNTMHVMQPFESLHLMHSIGDL